jgi:phospho-N-acetylmuramoyl-pentapeptide-transferase
MFTFHVFMMLLKLNQIIIFALAALFLALILYPLYIRFLKAHKAGQQIREASVTWEWSPIFTQLHQHKSWTPTMWGGLILVIMAFMVLWSIGLQHYGVIKYSLFERSETYILVFWLFSMWLIWLIDDLLNVKWVGKIKWLSAKAKLIWMFLFAGFISRWFYDKLGVDYINFWPIAGKIHLWIIAPIITFILTISIVNAINITDGLDGLAGGLVSIILFVLWIMTFFNQTYLATTLVAIMIACLLAFMFFNIYPAKIFMWDSWALAIGGFLATLLYTLNMRMWILLPFIFMFLLFIIDTGSSFAQILSKKYLKKKIFATSPLHHLFEYKGIHESTIVMTAWLLQAILAAITIIALFYQIA